MSTWLVIAIPLACVIVPNAIALVLLVYAARTREDAPATRSGVEVPRVGPASADDLEALWLLPAYRERALRFRR